MSLIDLLDSGERDPEVLLDRFIQWTIDVGIELYPAQEEALLELFADSNVILNTPTGSGKSLVALGAHVAAVAQGRRTFYTAPIKALVSEKFFALCRDLGSERVGMMTGDAAVNSDAPVICCTAEVLANLALREGPTARVGQVVMDEFHYYSDRDRGWAWQIPLLEIPDAQFLLMSATLGNTDFFVDDLDQRGSRSTAVVRTSERPVPLLPQYRMTPIHETITELLADDLAPVYIVHFTQRAATEAAGAMMSLDVTSKEEKAQIKEALGGFRFDTPVGKDLKRFLSSGIGVHHAGLLPKYRLLTEKLAQQGLLKLICGTDTLGVGVNVPIRTVLFTQLCKYDGQRTGVLTVRDFQQISGRAGRKGFDDVGHVWAQAPEHVIANHAAEAKAAGDAKKMRKLRKKQPPDRGYVHFDEKTFDRLFTGEPERLRSRFGVSHSMLLNLLDRPGDGCGAVRRRVVDNHEPRSDQRKHTRRAISIYRSLVDAGVVELLDEPDEWDRRVRIALDLQDEFALNQPLSPFVVQALEVFDRDSPDYALDVVTLVESVIEDPRVVLLAQLSKLKGELISEWKMQGVEYDERMARLEEVTWEKPLLEELGAMFGVFAARHPWVGYEGLHHKSVVRDMFERAMTFREMINFYGLKRSEGAVLRYLTDAYKALLQTVPEAASTPELDDIIAWLGTMVRAVDSSLIDEWERLRAGDPSAPDEVPPPFDLTATPGFAVMVRNEMFRWLRLVARRRHGELAELPRPEGRWRAEELEETLAPYWEEHEVMPTDAEARGPQYFHFDRTTGAIVQTIADPEGYGEWIIEGHLDPESSREEGVAVIELAGIRRQ